MVQDLEAQRKLQRKLRRQPENLGDSYSQSIYRFRLVMAIGLGIFGLRVHHTSSLILAFFFLHHTTPATLLVLRSGCYVDPQSRGTSSQT